MSRQHARIAVGEIPEIVVGAHFAAVNRVFGAHAFLHEGVAGLAHDRRASGGQNHFARVPVDPRVMDDLAARKAPQQFPGQQADQIIALNEAALAVVKEAAVEIPVPGNAQVRTGPAHRFGRGLAFFRQKGIGHAVGEMPVRFHLAADKVKGQGRGQLAQHQPGTAVARVGRDF